MSIKLYVSGLDLSTKDSAREVSSTCAEYSIVCNAIVNAQFVAGKHPCSEINNTFSVTAVISVLLFSQAEISMVFASAHRFSDSFLPPASPHN